MNKMMRKRGWPVVMALALGLVGALAVFAALSAPPGNVSHSQDSPLCDTVLADFLPECQPVTTTPEPTMAPNLPPLAVGQLADIAMFKGSDPLSVDVSDKFNDPEGDELTYTAVSDNEMVATVAVSGSIVEVSTSDDAGTATITVTANDGELDSAPLSFTVMVTLSPEDQYDIRTAADITEPGIIVTERKYEVIAPRGSSQYVFAVTAMSQFGEPLISDITVNVLVDANPPEMLHGSINLDSASDMPAGVELSGLLTIRARIDEGARSFGLEVECDEAGHRVDIQILDDQLRNVGTASILCVAPEPEPPEPDQVSSDCYAVTGHVDQMRDDARAVNEGYRADRPLRTSQEGDDTIEVLTGADDVQLTVTVGTAADGCDPGPVYIRFLDSDRKVFGAGIDKEATAVGVDVVGLECHGKLELNLERALSADDARWYDHYRLVTPGNPALAPYLAGNPGTYYQGNFRLFDPCPASGDHFYVEVYDNQSKRKVAEEQVVCVPPK